MKRNLDLCKDGYPEVEGFLRPDELHAGPGYRTCTVRLVCFEFLVGTTLRNLWSWVVK
jgi:hypothetical protein